MIDFSGKKVMVLDAHGIIYQVFHTMREMIGPKGQPTGAAYGFTRDVIGLLLKFEPDAIFCAFDMPGPTFRHKIYAEYKANRPPMPEDLRPQLIFVRQILEGLCVPRLELELYEADDILATAARRASEAGGEVILVTSDKDARQLIGDRVRLYNLRKESLYGAEELKADWGIRPDQVIDFQTMVGDATDNIPGIPLIGPKSAADLLAKYGTLEGIFEHAGEIKGKKGANIAAARESSAVSRALVTLDRDVPIEIDWDKGAPRGVDPDRLGELFHEFGFRSLLPQIDRLTERFGERVCQRDPALDGMYSLTEKKTPAPAGSPALAAPRPSLFDAADDEPPAPAEVPAAAAGLTEENRAFTEKIFAALRPPGETVYPEIRVFDTVPADARFELVNTSEEFARLCARLEKAPVVSVDLETVDIQRQPKARPRFALIAGIALCFEPDRAYYVPLRGPAGEPTLSESEVLESLRPILESNAVRKIGQNIKYDMIVFGNYGIRLRGVLFDTMVADYLLRAGEQHHNMDELAQVYLNYTTIKISELLGTGKSQKAIDEVPTAEVARYAAEDALVPWYLYPRLLEGLRKEPALLRLMGELEIPLISVLVELETNGIAINTAHFDHLEGDFARRLDETKREIERIIRRDAPDSPLADGFNMNSPRQLEQLLFDDMGIPSTKKTKKKTGRSTDAGVLEELAAQGYELPKMILKHRTIAKLLGTYIEPIPKQVHPVTGRIHASFNQSVAETGRLSSSSPNLQNIPVRTDEGKEIRHGFVPDGRLGFDTLISCDYSQVELRVLAHYSKDPHLIEAFENDIDVHASVAAQIFHVPLAEVTGEQRTKAKAVNFGLAYGQTAFGLAKALGISNGEAAEYIRGFFETYPGIREFFGRVLSEASRAGYVTTLLGRRRSVDGVRPPQEGRPLNMAERTAINTVIQGSAADLMKAAMVNVSKRLAAWNAEEPGTVQVAPKRTETLSPAKTPEKKGGFLFDMDADAPAAVEISDNLFLPDRRAPRGQLLLPIHDELLLETRREAADELAGLVSAEMLLGQPLRVPLKVDTEFSETW